MKWGIIIYPSYYLFLFLLINGYARLSRLCHSILQRTKQHDRYPKYPTRSHRRDETNNFVTTFAPVCARIILNLQLISLTSSFLKLSWLVDVWRKEAKALLFSRAAPISTVQIKYLMIILRCEMILSTSFSLSEVLIRYVLQFVDVCTHGRYETYERCSRHSRIFPRFIWNSLFATSVLSNYKNNEISVTRVSHCE